MRPDTGFRNSVSNEIYIVHTLITKVVPHNPSVPVIKGTLNRFISLNILLVPNPITRPLRPYPSPGHSILSFFLKMYKNLCF